MAVTINDIAAAAHVDASTVSRALRGDPRVKLETRNDICRLAEEMAYVPNRGARQLAGGRTGVISFCIGSLAFEYAPPAISVLDKELTEYGLMLTVLPENLTEKRFRYTLNLFEQHFCDGAVLFSPHAQPDDLPELLRLRERNFPIVCIDQWLKNYDFPAITNDAGRSIRELGRRMLRRGMNTALAFFPSRNTVSEARLEAAEAFLEEAGVPYVTELPEVAGMLEKFPGAVMGIFSDNPKVPGLVESFAGHPPSRCIGGMFDSWKFDAPKCFDTIFLCIQDIESTSKVAAEYIVRMLRGDKSIPPVTKIPPADIITPVCRNGGPG